MKILLSAFCLMLLISCEKDRGLGNIYEFKGYSQNNQGIFTVQQNEAFTEIPIHSGSHGRNRGQIWMAALQSFLFVFDLRKLEVINDTTIKISYFSENLAQEIFLPFNRDQVSIDIPNIEGETLIYNKEEDKFTLCGITYYFIPATNSNHLNEIYDRYFLQNCILGDPVNDYISNLIGEFELQELDTIDIISNELEYK